MNKGFMFLHRQLLKWEWFDNSNMVHIWIYLLLKANYQEENWHGVKIPRGSLVTSVGSIGKDTGMSARSVRTCLNRLKTTGEVTIKTTNKYSIVTICKYDSYNVQIDETIEQATNKTTSIETNKRQTNDKQTTTSNNNNKDNKEDNIKEKETNVSNKKKSIFIPPSLFEVVEYVHEKGYHFDAEKFHAYYESNGWMVGRNKMKDWKAACRTWEKNSQNNAPSLFSQETEMNLEPKKPEWE